MASILDMVRNVVTPDIIRSASGVTGESPAATEKAIYAAIPSVLAGVLGQATTSAGAERLKSTIVDGGYGASVLDNLGGLLGGGNATDRLLSGGGRLISSLFGDKTESLIGSLTSIAGVRPSSSSTLLNLVAPIVMSVIGKHVATNGFDVARLSDFLSSQRQSVLAAVPSGLMSQLGLSGLIGTTTAQVDAAQRSVAGAVDRGVAAVQRPWLSRWWPALAVGAVGLALIFMLLPRQDAQLPAKTDSPSAAVRSPALVTLPGGQRLTVDRGGFLDKVGTYLSDPSSGAPPKTFVFDNLNFETGSTRLTPQSEETVTTLITVLKAYPSTQIRLEGHTDNTGDPDVNKKLSVDRAEAIKQKMNAGGVAIDRISVEGFGQDRPLASNDTEEGRVQNRRIEMVVLAR